MILDRSNEFADAQALAAVAAASRNVSTNIVDLLSAGDAIGEEVYAHIRSLTAASGTATSVTITIEAHTAADFSAARTVLVSIPTTIAAMTAGKTLFAGRLPHGALRYLAVVIVPNGGTLTSSTDAFLSNDLQRNDFRTSAAGQPA